MASVQQDPSGNFHISFRFGGKRFKRSLKTKLRRKAEASATHVEENIRLVEAGRMEIPEGVDVPTYLLSDGKLAEKPRVRQSLKLSELLNAYTGELPEGSLEATTLKVMGVHMRHVCRILGGSTVARAIGSQELQMYVTERSAEKGKNEKNVSSVTIRKELSTFGSLWRWAESRELVSGAFPRKGIVFPKHDEKPPFQTWAQIVRQVKREGFSSEQASPLWDCLFLDTAQIRELLAYVQKNSRYGFLHPMCVVAAYTGTRRSELCRARMSDVDLESGVLTVRERKRSRAKRTTRSIPLTPEASEVLSRWFDANRASPYLFPEDHRCQRNRKGQADEGAVAPEEASHHLNQVLSGGKWSVISGWHIFRHSFISNCASKGIDQRFIDEWVGHQTDEQRRRYRHLFPESQAAAIESVFSDEFDEH